MTLSTRLKQSARRTRQNFFASMPIFLGVLLLTSMLVKLVPTTALVDAFSGNVIVDSLLGASIGSIAAGHPIASYLLAGELLSAGISLPAATALIVSWVTVGVVQLPAEALMLGRRFAIYRNLLCFVFAILVSYCTVGTLGLFSNV